MCRNPRAVTPNLAASSHFIYPFPLQCDRSEQPLQYMIIFSLRSSRSDFEGSHYAHAAVAGGADPERHCALTQNDTLLHGNRRVSRPGPGDQRRANQPGQWGPFTWRLGPTLLLLRPLSCLRNGPWKWSLGHIASQGNAGEGREKPTSIVLYVYRYGTRRTPRESGFLHVRARVPDYQFCTGLYMQGLEFGRAETY